MSWRRRSASEAAPGTVVRLFDDGADHHPGDRAHALEPPHQRAPGPAHARADLRGHHARLSHRLYPHGDGRVLCLAFLPQCGPGDCGPTGAGPLRATHLWRDVERRADRNPAVPVHGLSRRAGEADRPAVQEPASCHRTRAGVSGGGDDRHLRDLRDRHGHRRRGGDAHGPARVSRDAEGRIQRQGCGRRGDRGGLSRHPDSSLRAADRLWRGCWCVGRPTLRRGLIGAPEPEAEAKEPPAEKAKQAAPEKPAAAAAAEHERQPVPLWLWIAFAVGIGAVAVIYRLWSWERLEVFKMLLSSFFPLALLIVAVLGAIVFGLATPSEAAAVGGFGGFILAAVYRFICLWREANPGASNPGPVIWWTVKEMGSILKESSFLTAKTSAMVCWLFVGSGIFSAAFALLGGQELIEKWVLSLDMTPVQFMVLAQFIIFILGWPLEWTEIIIIFMPIFLPLLPHFNIDPLFFGLLVALNLQTAFLSPPVAMAAFYLKGVSPPHVTLNAIFAGMMPFMGIQLIALILLYLFPGIGLWLPQLVYGR